MLSEVKSINFGECVQLQLEFFPRDVPEQYFIEKCVVPQIVEYVEEVMKIIEESRGIKNV